MDYNKLGNIGPLINSVQVNIWMHFLLMVRCRCEWIDVQLTHIILLLPINRDILLYSFRNEITQSVV